MNNLPCLGLTEASPGLGNLYIQILGSTLNNFEKAHTEYSEVSEVTGNDIKTFLYEHGGYLPFEVTLNGTLSFMARDTPLPGVYLLIPLQMETIEEIHQVKIHLNIDMETDCLRVILRRTTGGCAFDVTIKNSNYYLDNSLVIVKNKALGSKD